MEIKKTQRFGEYDVYCLNEKVAEIRCPLFGSDKEKYIHMIHQDSSTRINTISMTESEALKKAVQIIQKKLYLKAKKTLEAIKTIDYSSI